MKNTILTVALMGFLQACSGGTPDSSTGGAAQVDNWKAELILADQVFSETVSREGFSEWSAFFTPNGVMVQEGTGEIRGVEAIQAAMDAAATGGFKSLIWSPQRAEVSTSGDMGYTVGTYHSTGLGPDGVEMESTGMYVSIWRRQADGSWKVEMDLGNPITEPRPTGSEEAGAGGDGPQS